MNEWQPFWKNLTGQIASLSQRYLPKRKVREAWLSRFLQSSNLVKKDSSTSSSQNLSPSYWLEQSPVSEELAIVDETEIEIPVFSEKPNESLSPERIKELETELKKELRIELEAEIKTALATELSAELETELEKELTAKLEPEIRTILESELEIELAEKLEPEIRVTLESEIETELLNRLEPEIRTALKSELKQKLVEQLEPEIRSTLEIDIKTELVNNLEPAIKTELKTKLEKELTNKLTPEIKAILKSELEMELTEKLTSELETELLNKFELTTKNELEATLEKELSAKLEPEIRAILESEIEVELTERLKPEIRATLESEIEIELVNRLEPLIKKELLANLEPEIRATIESSLKIELKAKQAEQKAAEQVRPTPHDNVLIQQKAEPAKKFDADTKRIVEAILFATDKPMTAKQVKYVYPEIERPDQQEIQGAINSIIDDYASRPVGLQRLASGYRFQVKEGFAYWVARLFEEKPPKYSRAALETIAIIAYRQPVTRGDIEDIRGVGVSSNIIRTLIEREWIRVIAHKEVPGRPALYGTTKQFLDYFNLSSLEQLPTLEEIKDLDFFASPDNQQTTPNEQIQPDNQPTEVLLSEEQKPEPQNIEPSSETRH